ncbi:MAG: gas vesicle protein GvpJ [Cyanobacteriota bacterium]
MTSTPILPTRPQTNSSRSINTSTQGSTLADILERVLDKGIVIAGDISISIASTELIHIRIRLLISSVDKAKEMGINWWESDPYLSTKAQRLVEENQQLQHRLESLEAKLNSLTSSSVKEEIPLVADVKDDLYQTTKEIPSPVDTPIEVLDFQAQTTKEIPSPVDTPIEVLDFQTQTSEESSSAIEVLDFQTQTSEESSSVIEVLDFQAQTSEESSSPVDPAIDV